MKYCRQRVFLYSPAVNLSKQRWISALQIMCTVQGGHLYNETLITFRNVRDVRYVVILRTVPRSPPTARISAGPALPLWTLDTRLAVAARKTLAGVGQSPGMQPSIQRGGPFRSWYHHCLQGGTIARVDPTVSSCNGCCRSWRMRWVFQYMRIKSNSCGIYTINA